mgnify:FL=1
MKIVTKETLGKMPIGTVFTLWEPYYMDGEIHIKTDDGYTDERPSWNGELYLHPDPNDISDDNLDKLDTDILSNMWTTDNSDIDYKDNQLFMVFSRAEVFNMANALLWALTGCKNGGYNMDILFLGDEIIEDKE